MNSRSLVSIIVPTLNSEKLLDQCLSSIVKQQYKNIEIIVVDNNSSDKTKEIASRYTKLTFNYGPERSSQRNYGAKKSHGQYLLFIDSDMKLSENVVSECIQKISKTKSAAIIIPEESYGRGFWAQCKKLERSFYVGVDWIEAARFYRKKIFLKVGGFNESLISAEDWDLSQRVNAVGQISRIKNYIYHNEGHLMLTQTLWKKFYYSKSFKKYQMVQKNSNTFKKQTGLIARYWLFFSQPKKLFKNPILGIGMLLMKTLEFAAGGIGYITSM